MIGRGYVIRGGRGYVIRGGRGYVISNEGGYRAARAAKNEQCPFKNVFSLWTPFLTSSISQMLSFIQWGESSPAKHGGAYFSLNFDFQAQILVVKWPKV